MKKSRRSRLRKSFQGKKYEAIGPTEETAARIKPDKILSLVRRGRLSAHHLDVVLEIRCIHEAVGRGMFPTAQYVSPAGRNRNRQGAADFLDRMSGAERRAWQRNYLPWSRELSLSILAGVPGTRWLQLVIDIAVDNTGLRIAEDRYHLRHGTAFDFLREGLERYPVFGRRPAIW